MVIAIVRLGSAHILTARQASAIWVRISSQLLMRVQYPIVFLTVGNWLDMIPFITNNLMIISFLSLSRAVCDLSLRSVRILNTNAAEFAGILIHLFIRILFSPK